MPSIYIEGYRLSQNTLRSGLYRNMALFCVVLLGLLASPVVQSKEPICNPAYYDFRFGDNLFNNVHSGSDNTLVSPLSLFTSLMVVLEGARGELRSQMEDSLFGLNSTSCSPASSTKDFLSKYFYKIREDDVLQVATQLFVTSDFDLKERFEMMIKVYLESGVSQVDFTKPDAAIQLINNYVEDHTGNKIQNMLTKGDVDESTNYVLINAVHFQAEWKNPFDKAVKESFFLSPNDAVTVEMMKLVALLPFYQFEDVKLVVLNFKKSDYKMVLILQDEIKSFSTESLWQMIEKCKEETYVIVKIPKFRIEARLDLEEVLENMGMGDLFNGLGDLTGISDQNGVIDAVIQKTYMDVNEVGVEAAGATATISEGMTQLPPQEFIANRPFKFFLIAYDVVIFEGMVRNPLMTLKTN